MRSAMSLKRSCGTEKPIPNGGFHQSTDSASVLQLRDRGARRVARAQPRGVTGPLRGQDREHLLDARLEPIVHHGVVEPSPLLDLAPGDREALRDSRGIIA